MSLEEKQLQQADVVAVVADLMFGSRLRAAAEAAGVRLALARSAEALPARVRELSPRLVLIDLDPRAGDGAASIRALRESESAARLVAYASHMDAAAIRAARDAGADEVLARSAFVKRLPELMSGR